MATLRLDKYLSQSGERSRSESSALIRGGAVRVNGLCVRDPGAKIHPEDDITLNGETVQDDALQYLLLYKPAGILTAARDRAAHTVMDLLPPAFARREVMPVGRLDKDTTGLLLLTNDGPLAHALLHPSRHVWKRYIATVSGQLTEKDVQSFREGLFLGDFTAQPAELAILSATPAQSIGAVRVHEGKFHQVKRMFAACGHEVLALHRDTFGPLTLPEGMAPGDYRPLTAEEISLLKQAVMK